MGQVQPRALALALSGSSFLSVGCTTAFAIRVTEKTMKMCSAGILRFEPNKAALFLQKKTSAVKSELGKVWHRRQS